MNSTVTTSSTGIERGPSAAIAPPLVMPRGLIFLAAVWLVGSWLVAMGTTTPVHATSASYEPGVRMMLQSVMLGFIIGWPLLRLSQPTKPAPVRQVLLDLIVLLTLMQVVVWLPRLLTNWLVIRTAALDATLAGWTILTAAFIAMGVSTNNPTVRTAIMLLCICTCLLGPLAAWFGLHIALDRPELAMLGPFMAVRAVTETGSIPPTGHEWRGIGMLWIVTLAAWVMVIARTALSTPDRDKVAAS